MPLGPKSPLEELRALARTRIEDGKLPIAAGKEALFGGYGAGQRCELCGAPISNPQVEYAAEHRSYGRALVFHIACHSAWHVESLAIRAASGGAEPADAEHPRPGKSRERGDRYEYGLSVLLPLNGWA